MNRELFLDKKHNELYAEQGFLHVPNFLSEKEVAQMKKLYNKREKSFFDKGFHRTLDLKKESKKRKICNEINQVVSANSEKYLNDYRYLLTSFMTKEKKAPKFDIHQNWTFVDESKFTSLVIWIPLQDTNEVNGTMHFIPKSDQLDKGVRGNNITWKYESIKADLLQEMVRVDMKAGDAVIFDDATIHYTSPNLSKQRRISIAQVMIPKESDPIFYHQNAKGGVEQYKIDDEFYLMFMNRYIPNFDFSDQELLQEFKLNQPQVELSEFKNQLAQL